MTELGMKLGSEGFVVLRTYLPATSTRDAASGVGRIVCVPGLDEVQTLIPRHRRDSTSNTYSGNYGFEEFPLHTDLAHWATSPHYVALRCLVAAESVPTRVLDTGPIVADMGQVPLYRSLVQSRRPIEGLKPLLRMLEPLDVGYRFRWDRLFLNPANDRADSMIDAIDRSLAHAAPTEVHLEEGDMLIFDNWRVLHGRAAVRTGGENRCLERVYLSEVTL